MKILNPNTGEEIVPVVITHVFVSVTDYGLKSILKEIIIAPAQHHWEWIVFSANKPIDIKDIGDRFSSFDHSLNRAVNDCYCTVYECDDFNEVLSRWESIKYVDPIKTVYKSKEV